MSRKTSTSVYAARTKLITDAPGRTEQPPKKQKSMVAEANRGEKYLVSCSFGPDLFPSLTTTFTLTLNYYPYPYT